MMIQSPPGRSPGDLTTRSATGLMRSARLWVVPTVVVVLVMGVLAAMYLSGSLNSTTNLKGFPLAIVNQDKGAVSPDGNRSDTGAALTQSLLSGIDRQKFSVSTLGLDEAEHQMAEGTLYGAIVVPPTFSGSLLAFAASGRTGTTVAKPVITVLTNPRAGTATPGILTGLTSAALAKINVDIGTQLLQQANASTGPALSGAAATALASPIDVVVQAHNPLPTGTGGGLSAFYYALLLILAGFTGSMIVSTLMDADLGFVPSEFGPVYLLRKHSGLSRTSTLVVKWVVMAGLSIVLSAVYLAISAALGMPIENPVQLGLFSAAAILAVALVAQAVTALFGGLGMLVNLFVFVIFSLPSAGGALPLEATPPFIRWLGSFEPMHQIYLGARSVLYLGGSLESGLGRSLLFCGVAAVLGICVGLLGTRLYDTRGMWRGHREIVDRSVRA